MQERPEHSRSPSVTVDPESPETVHLTQSPAPAGMGVMPVAVQASPGNPVAGRASGGDVAPSVRALSQRAQAQGHHLLQLLGVCQGVSNHSPRLAVV